MRRAALVLTLLLAACGSEAAPPSTGPAAGPSTHPVTVVAGNGPVTVETRPERIAALSPSHVEVLFALGAGDMVIAGDVNSNHPPAAATLPQLDAFNLNVEAVVDLDPDLVVLAFDPGGAVEALGAVGIPTLLLGTPSDLGAAYDQWRTLGTAVGLGGEANDLVARVDAEIAAAVDRAGSAGAGRSYYHEIDPVAFYTPTSQTFIGGFYSMLGMASIADAAPDEFASGYPQLSPEFILAADPDVIVLASFGESPETVAARPGWGALTAVREGRVFVIDQESAGRWGPRLADVMDQIAAVAEAAG